MQKTIITNSKLITITWDEKSLVIPVDRANEADFKRQIISFPNKAKKIIPFMNLDINIHSQTLKTMLA